MIAGPILPRNAESLWRLVREEPDRLESGLRIVRGELSLESGLVVDSIAADAVGRAVLLFGSLVEDDHQLPGRVAEARAWFARNARMLSRVLAVDGIDLSLPARAMVVGFDFTATCLERLTAHADDGLSVLRIEGFRLEGELHIGVQPLMTPETVEPAAEPFTVSSAMESVDTDSAGSPAEHFVDLLRRLDPQLRATGDRYARQWHAQGGMLGELLRHGDELRVRVPGQADVILRDQVDANRAFDQVMRRYLAVQGTEASEGGLVADDAFVIHDAPAPQLARSSRMGDVEISPEEYDAFLETDD